MSIKPLRIDFELSGHIEVPAMPIHFDSLVAFARFKSELETPNAEGEIRELIKDLPLGSQKVGDMQVWQASALHFHEKKNIGLRTWTRKTVIPDQYAACVVEGLIHRSKKPTGTIEDARKYNLGLITNKDGSPKPYSQVIDTVRGEFKQDLQKYPVFYSSNATAYCMGDADKLDSLLNPEWGFLENIGKRSRLGHGRIVSVTITEDKSAEAHWKRRILPWKEEGYLDIEATVAPPYWDASLRVHAFAHPDIF